MDRKLVPSPTSPDVARFDRWAATYEQSRLQNWIDVIHSRMLDLIARDGPKDPPGCIVDVGCGTGRLLRAASARWPAARLSGVDPAPHMIEVARRLAPEGDFQVAPAEAISFPDESADLVLSSVSFHHWANQKKGLQQIARVLRPEGWLCLADHVILLMRLFGEKPKSRKQIRALMTGVGLTVLQQQSMYMRVVAITLAQKEPGR